MWDSVDRVRDDIHPLNQSLHGCLQVSSLSSDKEEAERVARELSSKDAKLMEDKQVCVWWEGGAR